MTKDIKRPMYRMRGAPSPVADLQFGGVYQTPTGKRYYQKYPSISKFTPPAFSGDKLRSSSVVNHSRFLRAGSGLLQAPARSMTARSLYTIARNPAHRSITQVKRERAFRNNLRTLDFSVNL